MLKAIVVGLDLATSKFGMSIRKVYDETHDDPMDEIRFNTENLQLYSACHKGTDIFLRSIGVSQIIAYRILRLLEDYGNLLIVGAEALPSHGAFKIGELGALQGMVRRELLERFKINMELVPLSSCRSTFLGKYSNRDIKKFTLATVRGICGWDTIGPDAADAFVVANHLCSLHGFPFLSGAGQEGAPSRAPRSRKGRSRKAPSRVPGQADGA